MPFDSEGVFVRRHNWEDDRLNDIDIMSDRHDEEDDNFADGLSQCLLKNGTSAMSGNLNMGNFQIKNLAAGQSDNDAVNLKQLSNKLDDNSGIIMAVINKLTAIGDIKASVRSANHDNWLLCNGQEVSRDDYSELFALIGDNFGAGNGVTTFNLPDYRGKFLRGLGGNSAEDIYTPQAEGLPNITGTYAASRNVWSKPSVTGCFAASTHTGSDGSDYGSNGGNYNISFNAAGSNALYGASEHVTPENMAVNYFIKAKTED
ncbi:MAG: tail fiber protein [Alphaproteobacteria bacterium]|nr:tail fiber protein [Alphaproteobacteria bacterium]MBQ9235122.1 tail fiber protein [Alphaproteobacteria bacterium]